MTAPKPHSYGCQRGRLRADDAPGLVADPGDDQRRAVLAGQFQAAPDLVDVAGHAAAPDVDCADAQVAQPPGELLLVPRRGLKYAEGAGERRARRAVKREERDLRVDLGGVTAQGPGEVLDQ